MNVQSIWAGHDYAFSQYKGNKSFVMRAQKGKAIKVEKRTEFGGQRAKAYVHFEVEGYENPVVVRARDVIDFWDDYERERAQILREREEAEELARQARERQRELMEQRLAQERREREERERLENEKKDRLIAAFTSKTNMPESLIQSVSAQLVCLDRHMVEYWLSGASSS